MEKENTQEHWNKIYLTKELKDVSWFQPVPETSLDFVKQFNLAKDAKIIDIGGGDSLFVDYLLNMGYLDITVLDLSAPALERAKRRLGERATKVNGSYPMLQNLIPPFNMIFGTTGLHSIFSREKLTSTTIFR